MALSWVLGGMFPSDEHQLTGDPFNDEVKPRMAENPDNPVPISAIRRMFKVKRQFLSCLMGQGEYLLRCENLVHTLGSNTALCCTDKKGLISWPNASPEKVFLIKRSQDEESLTPEILNVTLDHKNPFKVRHSAK